jgi:hypothetical protein
VDRIEERVVMSAAVTSVSISFTNGRNTVFNVSGQAAINYMNSPGAAAKIQSMYNMADANSSPYSFTMWVTSRTTSPMVNNQWVYTKVEDTVSASHGAPSYEHSVQATQYQQSVVGYIYYTYKPWPVMVRLATPEPIYAISAPNLLSIDESSSAGGFSLNYAYITPAHTYADNLALGANTVSPWYLWAKPSASDSTGLASAESLFQTSSHQTTAYYVNGLQAPSLVYDQPGITGTLFPRVGTGFYGPAVPNFVFPTIIPPAYKQTTYYGASRNYWTSRTYWVSTASAWRFDGYYM